MRVLAVCVVLAACGDDGLPRAPATLSAGPVTITTSAMTIAVGDVFIDRFVQVGVADEVDETHYYDPRGDALSELVPLEKARGVDGEWLVLEHDVKLRLTACDGIADCAVLEIDASRAKNAVQLQLALPHIAGEPAYGTGDAAAGANVAGKVREMQLRVDPMSESSLNETHVPVPVVLWPRRNIGWFVADDRPSAFDVAASDMSRATATFTLPVRGTYRAYIYRTQTPLDLVRTYTALTAKPAVPPRWAFAPQQWRNVWNSSTEVRDDANEMRTRKIPGSLMWIDNPWQTAYNTFIVDENRLAAPQQLVADLAAQGYNVLFWSTPYVGLTAATSADRSEGAPNKFFVTDDAGKIIDYPWQDGPGALVDFTRPGATEFWRARIKRVVDIGARGFKLDFGEEVVPDIGGTILPMLLAGGDNSSHHARFSEGYHDAYLGALPPGDGFLITRAGAWGEQRTNTCVWPGDLDSDFSAFGTDAGGKYNVGGMQTAISRGLSLSMSGYPFYGSDTGGFRGFPTTEVLLRWAAYAAYGSIMQLGGGGKSHNPWDTTLFTAGADVTYKKFADIHMQLNPLLWSLAQQSALDGTPLTRPARFVYDCDCDDTMFLLGDDILVAPITTAGATNRSVVLPPGEWFDRASGARVTGDGRTAITVPAPLDAIPTWHRAGSLVPMFARYADTILPATMAGVTSYATPAFGSELRLVYAPGATGTMASTNLHDGASAQGDGTTITVTGGTEYSVFTVDVDLRAGFPSAAVSVDGVDIPSVADVTTCAAPGCWHATATRLEVRVFAPAGASHAVAVR